MRLAYGRDHGLAVCWPDNDSVHFLLDKVFHLSDLTGNVATGIQNDNLNGIVCFGCSNKGLLVRRLVAIDPHVVLRDTDRHGFSGSHTCDGHRRRRGRRC